MSIPVFVKEAGGGVIVDVDGNSIIDMGAGIAVVNVGNSADSVIERVVEQVHAFTHTCFMVAPYQGYVEVCEALNRLTPGNHQKKSALFNSGAEAVENAIKVARVFTKRTAVIVFEHGYHGRTNLTMGMTAKNMPYKEGFGPFAPEIYRMPMAYPFRWLGDSQKCAEEALDYITHKIEKEIGAKNVAAIVIEPIQGEGGFIVPPKGFLPGLAKFASENGALFIADEVQTGFGAIMERELRSMATKYEVIGEVRGRGAMQAIELVLPGSIEPNPAAMQAIVKYCQSKGVLLLTAGTYSNVIRLLPPLVMPEHLLREALAILEEAIAAL